MLISTYVHTLFEVPRLFHFVSARLHLAVACVDRDVLLFCSQFNHAQTNIKSFKVRSIEPNFACDV